MNEDYVNYYVKELPIFLESPFQLVKLESPSVSDNRLATR